MTDLRTELHEHEEELSTADMARAGQPAAPRPPDMARAAQPAAPRPPDGREAVRPEMKRPEEAQPAPNAAASQKAASRAALFPAPDAQALHSRWDEIQTGFVDNPRQAVEQADHLVAETIKRLAEMFANERNQLEQQWSRGDHVSTEDLRVALQRYRSFFDRLLSF